MKVDVNTASAMIYLLSCAVNRISPDPQRLKDVDLDGLFVLAQRHSLAAAVAYGLESGGMSTDRFAEAKAKALRDTALYDIESGRVYTMLGEKGVRYLPLKGAVLKSLYPSYGMREMSDVDILCDPDRMQDVRDGMEAIGFTCVSFDENHHDIYVKPPVTFEMHRRLFARREVQHFIDYYENVMSRLVPDEARPCGYRFTPEDLYVYILAHEYKHYQNGGTGLRSLLDIYVFLKAYGDRLDREALSAELGTLKLTSFEKLNRELSSELFTSGILSDQNRAQLEYFLSSGTFGNVENVKYNKTSRAMQGKDSFFAKLKYLLGVVFIHGEMLKRNYPFFDRHKVLLPALYIYRIFRAIFIQPFRTIADFRYIKGFKKTVDTESK